MGGGGVRSGAPNIICHCGQASETSFKHVHTSCMGVKRVTLRVTNDKFYGNGSGVGRPFQRCSWLRLKFVCTGTPLVGSVGFWLPLHGMAPKVNMHAGCPACAPSTPLSCPLIRRHRCSTCLHTPQLMRHEHHHQPLTDSVDCVCCSLILLSTPGVLSRVSQVPFSSPSFWQGLQFAVQNQCLSK